MGLLTGKTALVTGAARGIGKAVAMKFASEGANIAFTDLVLNDDMAAGLEATRKEIEALGVTCRAYAGNAADFEETEKTVKQIHADFGSIDILVNNAGITKDGLMLRMTEAQWDAVLNVNLKSAFNFIHACSPIMVVSVALVLLLVSYNPMGQCRLGLLRHVLHNRPIGLVNLAIPEHGVQSAQSLRSLGKHHESRNRTVKSMHHTQEYISRFLVFLLDILFYRL